MPTKKYYAYILPDGKTEITDSWAECERAVKNQKGARYKSFKEFEEAEKWLSSGGSYAYTKEMPHGVYFDAGTGRGEGVEISVTDETKKDLLSSALGKELINAHGKHLLPSGKTNNYGELMACFYALTIAKKHGIKSVFGDSGLVINYWSKGFIKNTIEEETRRLALEVSRLRKEFEATGGEVRQISGDDNPADLGFHK